MPQCLPYFGATSFERDLSLPSTIIGKQIVVQDDFLPKEYLCVLDPALRGKLFHAIFMRSLLD